MSVKASTDNSLVSTVSTLASPKCADLSPILEFCSLHLPNDHELLTTQLLRILLRIKLLLRYGLWGQNSQSSLCPFELLTTFPLTSTLMGVDVNFDGGNTPNFKAWEKWGKQTQEAPWQLHLLKLMFQRHIKLVKHDLQLQLWWGLMSIYST